MIKSADMWSVMIVVDSTGLGLNNIVDQLNIYVSHTEQSECAKTEKLPKPKSLNFNCIFAWWETE